MTGGKLGPWVGVNWVAVRWHSHLNDEEVIVRLWSCWTPRSDRGTRCVERGAVTSPPLWRVRSRQCWRQPSDQWVVCLSGQEIVGLCFSSQGSPRMIGVYGDWKTNSRIVSVWKAPVHSDRSSVVNWIRPEPSGRPSSAATAKRDSQATRGILWVLEKAESMKFPAAPESIKAVVSITSPLTLKVLRVDGEG